jgi:methylated-DNA-[protein]-cysteine S-methyltransferase
MPAAILSTDLGHVGLAWSGDGLTRLSLPESNRAAILRRLGSTGETPLPDWLLPAAHAIGRYAAGEREDFADVAVDLSAVDDPFRRAIYAAARRLCYGETTTYGELAALAGFPGMARETGAALGTNPVPLIVPCHRILAAGGKIGGFSAPGGSATKLRLLALEGVRIGPAPSAQAAFQF